MNLESLFSDHSNGTFIQYSVDLLRIVAQALDEAEAPTIKFAGQPAEMRKAADAIRLEKIREIRRILFSHPCAEFTKAADCVAEAKLHDAGFRLSTRRCSRCHQFMYGKPTKSELETIPDFTQYDCVCGYKEIA